MKKIMIHPYPRRLKEINNHRYVCSFFLNKYLGKYFEVHSSFDILVDEDFVKAFNTKDTNKIFMAEAATMEKAIALADTRGVDYFLSTAQRGITKIKDQKFDKIKKLYPNIKLMSMHDHWVSKKFKEDYLFIAQPIQKEYQRKRIIKEAYNSNLKPIYTGWCADHMIFKRQQNDAIGIVLDHAALEDYRKDLTNKYTAEIIKLKTIYPKVQMCRLNMGFEFFDFSKQEWVRDERLRWWSENRLPPNRRIENGDGATIFQIAECLSNSKIFCVTHVESCGLTGIEALMAGCKLYVPKGSDKFRIWGNKGKKEYRDYYGTFIKEFMLEEYMNFAILDEAKPFLPTFINDAKGVFPILGRKKLIQHNSWEAAAKRIYEGLK